MPQTTLQVQAGLSRRGGTDEAFGEDPQAQQVEHVEMLGRALSQPVIGLNVAQRESYASVSGMPSVVLGMASPGQLLDMSLPHRNNVVLLQDSAMTMTVKLDPTLEQRLRQRSAALGRPASEIIREALQAWLLSSPEPETSAYALGSDLFGRHRGPADLAARRKQGAADLWADKHAARGR